MSWCEQPLGNQRGHFISAQHALLSEGGENKLCPDCAEAMKLRIDQVSFEQKHMSGTHREPRADRAPHPGGAPYRAPSQPADISRGPTDRIPPTLENFGTGQ